MKKDKVRTYIFLHIILLVYSFGGIFSKLASHEQFMSIRWIMLYGGLIFTLGAYAVCWQQILKKIPLNLAYVNKSVTIVWSMLFGTAVFRERLTALNIIGGITVAIGVLLIVTSDNKNGPTD